MSKKVFTLALIVGAIVAAVVIIQKKRVATKDGAIEIDPGDLQDGGLAA